MQRLLNAVNFCKGKHHVTNTLCELAKRAFHLRAALAAIAETSQKLSKSNIMSPTPCANWEAEHSEQCSGVGQLACGGCRLVAVG